jgi:hypothetical protein
MRLGITRSKSVAIPEDSTVGLLSLLPIDQTGKKAKGLGA